MTEQVELSELDRAKKRIEELAQEVVALQGQLQDREDDVKRQLKAWALDRAIETLKHNPAGLNTTSAKETAEEYVFWVTGKETVQ